MTSPNEPQDEQQFESLLKSAQSNGPPPDAEALARLRTQSAEAFAAAVVKPRMPFKRAARWLAAAAIATIGFGVYVWLGSAPPNITFGQLLDEVENAKTVHVSVTNHLSNRRFEYWRTNENKSWRMDLGPNGGRAVGIGPNYWVIDEAQNQARTGEHYYAMSDSLVWLMSAIGIVHESEKCLAALPVRVAQEGSTKALLYEVEMKTKHTRGVTLVRADIDAKSGRLTSLTVAWQGERDVKPVAELTVIAYDEPIDAAKFAIADTLTEDGRIGKVGDVQGVVGVKPVLRERWTPVREGLVLKPGDWVRTDARGANAAALRLVKDTNVILGPRTLVELIGPTKIRLIEGEIEITPPLGRSIDLLGPGQEAVAVKAKQLFHVEKQRITATANDPPWLLGFKGATTNESLGSLIAIVDGRNVPLTVGYHKVTVDIRDQISRTVIEESFVNHTNEVLEGVFHFPLPQDASISGFGMWIGDNYVEADVVEKQRAREIYETILREKRDPGLLEWSGGNIFKARVYPIPARGAKRIKITYTQVLPLKGNRYRYSYSLQSDLLKQHPLRELAIDVKINSVVPLKSVASPTHSTRDDLTSHSGHVEFTAQEYTPTRDFEVVVELDKRQSDVVLIPHRRGDDGYFMLQLMPPGADGQWDRALLPNGEPLNLLILADTSASIDAGQRATQAALIAALLGSLTPKDTFNLAACDVTCDWTFTQPTPAESSNISSARDFLAKRTSLGWTDLDKAFASAMKQCGPKTHVIYVGDGIPTTGDADPVAFAKRLRRLYEGQGTFHAVSVGSSYESGVLKAIASLGGGSMRKINADQGPAAVARELLAEIAQPGLRDIKVEFKSIKVARLYPESVANVAAGSQQILLGRYLPEGKDATGEVIVTGTQAGKPVRFTSPVSLKDAEHGNSFIPRLWARMHLDSLLEQGSSEAIRDEIISLSEEFHIITPYTSLLILETDADRERFKVKRRFLMRDGERFFADGRDNAVFDLAAKQMQRAAAWRTALRRSVLSELAGLGREPRVFQPRSTWIDPNSGMQHFLGLQLPLPALPTELGRLEDRIERFGVIPLGDVDTHEPELAGLDAREPLDAAPALPAPLVEERLFEPQAFFSQLNGGAAGGSEFMRRGRGANLFFEIEDSDWRVLEEIGRVVGLPKFQSGQGTSVRESRLRRYGHWLNTLFPIISKPPGDAKEPKSTWPATALALSRNLLRTEALAKLSAGIEITRQRDAFDSHWGDMTGRSRQLELFSAKAWLTSSATDGGQTIVSWCDGQDTGVFSKAFQLGRQRASTPGDVQPPPLDLRDHSLTPLHLAFPRYEPTVEPQGKDRTLLILKQPREPQEETRVLIDTARNVILSIEERGRDKARSVTQFSDFVEVGGSWWARRIESLDENGKRVSVVTQSVKPRTLVELDQLMKTELAERSQVQFLHLPLPKVDEAKKAVALGKAKFEDRFVLLYWFEQSQQWPKVLEHLQAAEKLAVGKPGLRWLRSALLRDARRYEEVRLRHQEEAARLAKASIADAFYLAEQLVDQSRNTFEANETLALLDALKPVYDRQPPHVHGRRTWLQQRIWTLDRTQRDADQLMLRKMLAVENPHDRSAQEQYARALADSGDYPAAYAWLTRVLVKEARWTVEDDESLRSTYANFLEQQRRDADLLKYLAAWVELNPPGRAAYERYLTALIKADQIEKADDLAARWLKEAETPKEPTSPAASRLSAAVNWMLGEGYELRNQRVEERWLAPLGRAALFFARHESTYWVTERIVSSYAFQRTDEAPKVRKTLASQLTEEVGKLRPEDINRFLGWIYRADATPADWGQITASLRQRWSKEANDERKHELGRAMVNVLARSDDAKELLAFLRLQMQAGPTDRRAEYATELFDQLLAQPWQVEYEAQAFGLLDKLSSADEPGVRLWTAVAALHRLTDQLLEGRSAAQNKRIDHPEKLTRTELAKKQQEIRRAATEALADRLRQEAGKHVRPLSQWLLMESTYLDVAVDRNLKQGAADAWAILDAAPDRGQGKEWNLERQLNELLRQRALTTLMNLAARKSAEPGLAGRLVQNLDQAIKADADDSHWKLAKYHLLIALDRAKELEQTLHLWSRLDDPDRRWHVALGYLLAEQGKLADAIREFEAVEAADELLPSEYRALADWYLAQGQRDQHERAAAAVYRSMPEHQLGQLIAAKLDPWTRRDGRLPTDLDAEVLRVFRVLFEKSARPEGYLTSLAQFYQAAHDFRLLAMLPDSVVGQTAERIYPFLAQMQPVLDEVRDEATADEIVKRVAEVRPRAKSAVDERALDLLEALVQRRAAEVGNQPGPHVDKALTALQRAFQHDWGPGEPRLMADFLGSLVAPFREPPRAGQFTQAKLAEETLRQLRILTEMAKPGSNDRLHIAMRHALTLRSYQKNAAGIDVLQAALDEYQLANNGVLPLAANRAFDAFLALLEDAGHFMRGEKMLQAQLDHPANDSQRRWLERRLDRLAYNALQNKAAIALGQADALYRALDARLQKEITGADQHQRHELLGLLCDLHRTAFQQKLAGAANGTRAFAFEWLPPILKQQAENRKAIVTRAAELVHDVLGPRDGMAFLLDEIEQEPRWLRFNNQDGWTRHGWTLATWRLEVKDLGDLDVRLLKLTLRELRRDLEMRETSQRVLYNREAYPNQFWTEKADDFAKTAEAVLAKRSKSSASVQHIANYFWSGLDRPQRAIEILLTAHEQKVLDESGQATLVKFLQRRKRFAESIVILQPLVERWPDYLEYRVQLMHAYFGAGKKAELLALLKNTDALFRQQDRWTEAALAQLADSTVNNELFEQSVAYYKELIPLHERTHANRGIGNGTLSGYYLGLANAYAGLKQTPDAVEAAGAAIIAWGSKHEQRAAALRTLQHILMRSPDLDGYAAHLDRQSQDSGILRKALGLAYQEKKAYPQAIKQFELAAALQPNDAEIYAEWIKCLDAVGDKAGPARVLLQAVQVSRRDVKLYQDLGKRLADSGKAAEAERAYTSIVEVLPAEAESHVLLAEIREKQNRWSDAVDQWAQVARLRSLEPTGLLKLAAAQLHEKQWDGATATLQKLNSRSWPARFGDVQAEIRKLEEKLSARKLKM